MEDTLHCSLECEEDGCENCISSSCPLCALDHQWSGTFVGCGGDCCCPHDDEWEDEEEEE